MKAEQLTEPLAGHGEGPVWSQADEAVVWLDMFAGRLLSRTVDGRVRTHPVDDVVTLVRPDVTGGLLAATAHDLLRGCGLDGPWRRLLCVEPDPELRLNEGTCDREGRLWIGTMAWDARPRAGSLRIVDDRGRCETVIGEVSISNGIDWTADGSLAYYADSPTGEVVVWDDVRPETRRRFATIDPDLGEPDGLCVDASGNVWVAVWGGSVVHVYAPDGTLVEVVELPCTQVTACTFGGAELGTLFVTTSRHELEGPTGAAGALFAVEVGPGAGQPARAFAAPAEGVEP